MLKEDFKEGPDAEQAGKPSVIPIKKERKMRPPEVLPCHASYCSAPTLAPQHPPY